MEKFSIVGRLCFLMRFLTVIAFFVAMNGKALIITKHPAKFVLTDLGGEFNLLVETDGQDTTYQWQLNGVNIPGETNSVLSIKNVAADDCGIYTVAVSDKEETVSSNPARVVPAVPYFDGADKFEEPFNIDPRSNLNPAQGVLRTANTNATSETGEPLIAGQKGGKSVWFHWIAPKSGIVTFTARGSGFDTLLAAFVGRSLAELQLVSKTAQDDDVGGFLTSKISFNVQAESDYFILLDGYQGASGDVLLRWIVEETGDFLPSVLEIPSSKTVAPGSIVDLSAPFEGVSARWYRDGNPTETTGDKYTIDKIDETHVGRYLLQVMSERERTVATLPADIQINVTDGDTDAGVAALDKFAGISEDKGDVKGKGTVTSSAISRGYTTTQIFSTVGATKDPGEPNHCGVVGGASEWFAYQAQANGTLHINTDGSSYNTVLAVYTGSGFDYASLTCVASNNVAGNGGDRVRFGATSGTIYYIAVDGVGGASGTVKLNVNLGDAPSITAQPQSKTVATGSNVTFSVTATGSATLYYQWRINGVTIAGATNTSYTKTNAQTNATYSVVVSNMINTATSSGATLTVLTPPSITSDPSGVVTNAGANVTFSVGATGSATLKYQWKFNGANLLNQTNATLSLTNVQHGNVGNYSVLVTNAVGTATSADAALQLFSAPVISSQPVSRTASAGGAVTLNVGATGAPTPSYQWQFNGANLLNGTAASLTITNFQAGNEGAYRVVVSNSVGSVTSSTASVVLNAPLRVGTFEKSWDGTFNFQLIGAAGSNYVFQASTNLTTWISLQTNSSSTGFLNFTDSSAPAFTNRFYRIISQ